MLPRHSPGQNSSLLIPFIDDPDVAATPVSGRYRILNGNTGVELQGWQNLTIPTNAEDSTIVINATINTLTSPNLVETREVKYELTMPNGRLVSKSSIYAVGAVTDLTIMTNSFATYPQLLLIAESVAQLSDVWAMADEARRKAALTEAFDYLRIVPFKNVSPGLYRDHVLFDDTQLAPMTSLKALRNIDMRLVTAVEFAQYADNFKNALYKAQLLAADDILGSDEYSDDRRSGLMSKSVGESSNMFRPGTPLMWRLSRRVLESLTGYIDYNTRAGR